MGTKIERLQKKYDTLVRKSEKDSIIDAKEEERLTAAKQALDNAQKAEDESARNQEELEKDTSRTNISEEIKEVADDVVSSRMEKIKKKSAIVIASERRIEEFKSLKDQIQETQQQLLWIASKANKRAVIRAAKKYERELDDAIRILNVNITYEHKLQNGIRFTKDVRDPHYISDIITKIKSWIASVDDKAADLLTGDTSLADKKGKRKKDMYLPGNMHPESDLQKGTINTNIGVHHGQNYDKIDKTGDFWDRAGKGGLLGALDAGLEAAGANYGLRRRTYEMGKLARGATKLVGTAVVGWNIIKEGFLTIKEGLFGGGHGHGDHGGDHHEASHASKLLKWMAIGGAGYILMPSVDQLVRGGETSKRIADRAGSDKADAIKQDTELMVDSSVTYAMFKDIPWKDRSTFTDNGLVDANKFHAYVIEKEGEQSLRLQYWNLVGQNPDDRSKVQNFLAKDMLITPAYIAAAQKENPNGNISKPYQEIKNKTDAIAEIYDGKDQANITPMLNDIEKKLANTDLAFAFKAQKVKLEEQINILHFKHPRARPIQLAYNTTTKTIDLTTYGQTTALDILSGNSIVSTSYSDTARSATSLNEAIRIGNFINFTAATYSGSSDFDNPLNLSFDGTEQDIEFSKTGGWTSGLAGLDMTILEDTWFNNFDTDFPSINNEKKGFVERFNGFQKNNESLWNKNSSAFTEIRDLEEKFKNDYGIEYTTDIEKDARKMSGLLKALGIQYEGLTNDGYYKALTEIDKALSQFPPKLLQKTKLDYLALSKNADLNGFRDGKADATTAKLLGGSINIDVNGTQGINHLIAHEYVHNIVYKNNIILDKRPKLGKTPGETVSLNTLGYITPYGAMSPEEDMCEIAGVLFNGGTVSKEYQKELSKYNRNGNLFERIKIDSTLLKKVELFTGCKVNPTNSSPFLRSLTTDERKAYGFEGPAFFSKRCSDAGAPIDQDYWNNLKKSPIT